MFVLFSVLRVASPGACVAQSGHLCNQDQDRLPGSGKPLPSWLVSPQGGFKRCMFGVKTLVQPRPEPFRAVLGAVVEQNRKWSSLEAVTGRAFFCGLRFPKRRGSRDAQL